jgi:hypothetical protein
MIIAIDFDGTCVTNEYPNIGRTIGAESVLKELTENGHQLILFTMRSDRPDGTHPLSDAVNWFYKNEIPLWGINCNPKQSEWTQSPKAYAQMYIDDAALGCPLVIDLEYHDRAFADWTRIRQLLTSLELLKSEEILTAQPPEL